MTKRDLLIVRLAALCHDMGKPSTTEVDEDGIIRSNGHANEAEGSVISFLQRIGFVGSKHSSESQIIIESVCALVREHMVSPREMSDKAIRRLARRLAPATVDQLAALIKADRMGRGGRFKDVDDGDADFLVQRAKELCVQDSAPSPIVMGRHLISMGMKPGPEMGAVLKELFEMQLDGVFSTLEEGLEVAQKTI